MNGLLTKFIIDDSMFTKVDKGTFYYETSYTSKENYKELLDYETVNLNNLFISLCVISALNLSIVK